MTYVVYPILGGGSGGGGGGGGGGSVTYPLNGPAGSSSSPTFSVGGEGGLFSPSSGGVALASGGLAALIIDASQNVSLVANLAVAGSTTLHALQAAAANVASLTSSGNASIGGSLGVTMDAVISGNLSAKAITATSALTAGSLTSQSGISGQSLTISGNAEFGGNLRIDGTFSVAALASSGPFYFPITGADAPGLALTDDHATGIYGTPNHVLGFSTNGQSVAYFDGTGAFNLAGAMAGSSAVFQAALTAASLASPAANLGALDVSGATNLTGPATLANDLDVQGTTRLANLVIDTLSTQNSLDVGKTLDVSGLTSLHAGLVVTGDASASGSLGVGASLNVSGSTTIQGLNAAFATFADIKLALPDGSGRPAVSQASLPSGGIIAYAATLDNLGNMAISSDLRVLGAAAISGAATAYSAALQAGVTAASATLTGNLSALTTAIGGATISSSQGNPTGQTTGSVGDVVLDRTGGLLYLKTTGAGTSTGWVPVSLSSSNLSYPLLAPDDAAGTAPAYAFASNSMRGLGYKPGAGLYLATAGGTTPAILMADNNAAVAIGPPLSLAAALTVQGASSLAGLAVSGGAQLASSLNVAGATTLAGATSTQALAVQGALTGGTATLTQVSVVDLNASDALTAAAGITSQAYLAAPQLRLSDTPAVVSAGTSAPSGSVTGSPGDLYLQDGAGAAWIKVSGSSTTSGWAQVSTSASGTAFPLTAPDGSLSAPSYGFSQGSLGLTATGVNALSAITGGAIGWTLKADKSFALAGALTVAAAASFAAGAAITGDLSATGQAAFAALSAASGVFSSSLSAASLSSSGDASVGGAAHISGAITGASAVLSGTVSAARVASGGSNWFAGAGIPASGNGVFGDIASDQTSTDASPFYVRTATGWQAVALAGAPAPTSFPLLAPADSAAAPSYSWAASPKTGAFSPGVNRYALATNGVSALSIDASQNVTLTAGLTAQATTLASATISGAFSAGGTAQIGGTLQVTGQSTLSGPVSSGAVTSSGGVSGTSVTASGLLSGNTLQITSDASIGGNLAVTGTVTFSGVSRSPFYQASDGTQASPSYAFTSESTTGIWRPGNGQIGFAAANASLLNLAAAKATFPATVGAALIDAPTVRSSGGTLVLQGGTTTGLTLTASAIAAALPIFIPAGSTTAPSIQVGFAGGLSSSYDSRAGFTSLVSLTNPTGTSVQLTSYTDQGTLFGVVGLQFAGAGIISSRPNPNGFASGQPGQIYQKNLGGAGSSLWVYEGTSSGNTGWASLLTSSSTITPTYPAIGPAGTAAAATFAVGNGGTGIYSGIDAMSRAFLGLTQGGAAVARLAGFTNNSLPVYQLSLGDPTSTSASGGFLASAQVPSTGAPGAFPGMLYQYLGGGSAQSLWVNESTTSTPSWAKVITTSSPNPGVTFPLVGPAGTIAAPTFAVGQASTGLYGPTLSGITGSVFSIAQNGSPVSSFYRYTAGSAPVMAQAIGDPTALASVAFMTVSAQSPLSVIGATGGSIHISPNAGVGQSLWVNEGTTNTNTGWAKVLSTGQSQIAGQNGTAAAPYHSFLGQLTSGVWGGSDAFSNPIVGFSVAGVNTVLLKNYTLNSLPVYICSLGNPASTTINGGIMASSQTPVNQASAYPGQIYQWLGGGAGKSLWVYEGTTNGSSAWASVLTSTSTVTPTYPLVGPAGTAAAPTFSATAGNGLYCGDMPYIANAGKQAIGFSSNIAAAGYSGITLGAGNTDGVPYIFGVPSTAASAGNPNTLALSAARAALMLNGAGASGNQLWIHEPASSSTGWVRVLSENTALSFSRLLQTTAPAIVTGQSLIYARTDNQIGVVPANSPGVAATLKQEVAAVVYGATQTLTVAYNGVTTVATGATQFTLTLPATQTATDMVYNFQIEGTGGFKIQAPSGVTIYNGTSASTSGGSQTSSAVGSFIELFNRAGSSLWIARASTGTWVAA